MAKPTARDLAGSLALTPHQIALLRGHIAVGVRKLLPDALEAAEGKRKWNNIQATIFRTLLNKVVPDLNASISQVEITHRTVHEMSRDQLERIAAGLDAIAGPDPIEVVAEVVEEPNTDSREPKK